MKIESKETGVKVIVRGIMMSSRFEDFFLYILD